MFVSHPRQGFEEAVRPVFPHVSIEGWPRWREGYASRFRCFGHDFYLELLLEREGRDLGYINMDVGEDDRYLPLGSEGRLLKCGVAATTTISESLVVVVVVVKRYGPPQCMAMVML
jgi:hypothetical protein